MYTTIQRESDLKRIAYLKRILAGVTDVRLQDEMIVEIVELEARVRANPAPKPPRNRLLRVIFPALALVLFQGCAGLALVPPTYVWKSATTQEALVADSRACTLAVAHVNPGQFDRRYQAYRSCMLNLGHQIVEETVASN